MRKKLLTIRKHFLSRELYRHPFAVPLVTLVALCGVSLFAMVAFGGMTIGAGDSHVVQLTVEGQKESVPTRAATVEDFLSRAQITVNPGDVVEPSRDSQILTDNFRINVYRARPVTIFDGTSRVQALSAAKAPRTVAEQAGVTLYPEDNLNQEVSNDILKDQVIGEKIVIERATPIVLNLYGKSTTVRTHVETVGELLQEKGVVMTRSDAVSPRPTTKLRPNMAVFVTRSGIKVTTVEETIDSPIEYVEDASLSFGATAVRQEGKPGKKQVTYEIKLKNGKEVSRKKIQSVTVSSPVKRVIARGKAFDVNKDKAAVMAAAGISSSDYPYVDYIVSRESGWRVNATNGSTWGLCQALPGNKMSSAGADWQTNPVTQLRWCAGYAAGKGGWASSYELWVSQNYW